MSDELIKAIEQSIINQAKKTDFIKEEYSDRKPLPKDFINKAWARVDWTEVLEKVTKNLEIRICNSIVANMETEIKSDIKKLLSVDGVRQKLRLEVYPALMNVLKNYEGD